jgi:hypothetical protein
MVKKVNARAVICKNKIEIDKKYIDFNDLLENIELLINYIRKYRKNRMKNKTKRKIGSIGETFMEVTTLALPELLDPNIAHESTSVVVKTLQKIVEHFLIRFFNESKKQSEAGNIRKENFITEKPLLSFSESIKIIKEGEIDEQKFNALKSIFFSGISMNSTERDEFWSYEFLKVIREVSGAEILILKAIYEIVQGRSSQEVLKETENSFNSPIRARWRYIISLQMDLGGGDSIVFRYENNLEKLGLISPRNEDDRFSNEFTPTPKYRLTEMGYKFCEFMTKYE